MKSQPFFQIIKYLLAIVGILALTGLILALVAFKVMQGDDYRRMTIWAVDQLTDYRMVADGDFEVDWSQHLRFTATDLRFESKGDTLPPALRTIGRLHTRIQLAPLLRGILLINDLEIERLQLTHTEEMAADDRKFALPWPLNLLTPVLGRVSLDELHFNFQDEQDRGKKILLQHLIIDDIDDQGPLFLQAHGRINTIDFRMTGRTGGTLAMYEKGRPFPHRT